MPQLIRDLSLDARSNGGKPTSQQQVCIKYPIAIEKANLLWV